MAYDIYFSLVRDKYKKVKTKGDFFDVISSSI